MTDESPSSEFRVVKDRIGAVLTLSNGGTPRGSFFVARGSPRHAGHELVGDLLNTGDDFFPFEVADGGGARTLLFNRRHVVMVALTDNEAALDPAYGVAPRRVVSVLLSSGQHVIGTVRVYGPEGHARLSDWAHAPESFHYIETPEATVIVNMAHIIEVNEVSEA